MSNFQFTVLVCTIDLTLSALWLWYLIKRSPPLEFDRFGGHFSNTDEHAQPDVWGHL